MVSAARLYFLLTLLVGTAGPSWAAPEPARTPRAAKAKRAPDGRVEFERAMALFQAGDHAAARPLFEQAYALSGKRPSAARAGRSKASCRVTACLHLPMPDCGRPRPGKADCRGSA